MTTFSEEDVITGVIAPIRLVDGNDNRVRFFCRRSFWSDRYYSLVRMIIDRWHQIAMAVY